MLRFVFPWSCSMLACEFRNMIHLLEKSSKPVSASVKSFSFIIGNQNEKYRSLLWSQNFNFEMMYFQLLLLCLPLVALGSQLGSLQYDHLSKEVENLDAPPLHGKIFTQLGFFFNVHPLHGELYFFSKKLIFSLLFPTTPSPFCQSVYQLRPISATTNLWKSYS